MAWIFYSENKMEKQDKPSLLKMIRKLVYSRTNEEFNNEWQTMKRNQTFLKYEKYAQHINEKILPRRDEWSLLFRIESQLPTNNVNTSNSYMQKTCDVAEKAILAKKKLRKKCVNRDKM